MRRQRWKERGGNGKRRRGKGSRAEEGYGGG